MAEPEMRFIRAERRGAVLWVTIDRPDVRNALHPPASAELSRCWDLLESEADLHVAVLTGAGDRAFCAGFDLKWGREHPVPLDQARVTENGGFGGLTHRRVGKPVIAAVNGPAMGGGFELVLACDLVVASQDARFGFPEVSLGLVANAGGVQRLVRSVPPARALAVIISGATLTARQAYELGLVSEVVTPAAVGASSQSLAERVAAMPVEAVAAAREVAYVSTDLSLSEALRYRYPAIDRLFESRRGH